MKIFTSLFLFMTILVFTGNAQTCNRYVGGYVPYYRNAAASNIDYTRVSDLFYAFAGSDSTGAVIIPVSPDVPAGNLDTFTNATSGKNRYLSIEGGNGHSVRDMAYSATARASFVTNCVNFCKNRNFQGIDVDWENIQSSADAANYDTLIGALATALHSNSLKMVITVNYGNYNAGYYNINTILKADWIQLMVYDQTGYGPSSPFGNPSTYQMMLDAIAYWQGRGYTDLSKMVIGLPFYGLQFSSTAGGYAPGVTYASIMNANPNLKADQDQDSLTFFNSAALIRRKVDYVQFNGLKGVMIWELGQDLPSSNTKSLLRAVSDAVCNQNPFWSDYSNACATNVAVGKQVDASYSGSTAQRITDNNLSTVWSSNTNDTDWVSVDLGGNYNVCRVEIVWDNTGIGRDFLIKSSLNDSSWQTIDERTYNSSLVNTLDGLSVTTRWIGFQGLYRGCNSRYKIAELRVFGSPATGGAQIQKGSPIPKTPPVPVPASGGAIKIYPNPSSGQFSVDLSGLPAGSIVTRMEILDAMGRRIKQIDCQGARSVENLNAGRLSSGIYLVRLIMDHQPSIIQRVVVQH